MRRRPPLTDAIDFPANPFVALADFTMVVLLLVMLGFVYQSVSSNRLFERIAVINLQSRLREEIRGKGNKVADIGEAGRPLFVAYEAGHVKETFVDGDLQRFWLDGRTLYAHAGYAADGHEQFRLTEEGRAILTGFGKVLQEYQGNIDKPGSGLFKRILVQGNADRSEGDDDSVWALSLARAREAAQTLQIDGGVSPLLIEASGRGCWDPRKLPSQNSQSQALLAAENRRLEIIVIYSAQRAARYEEENRLNQQK